MGNPVKYVDIDGKEYGIPEWDSNPVFDIKPSESFGGITPTIYIPQFVLERMSFDSYNLQEMVKDDPQKKEKTDKTKSATALPISILTTLGTAAESLGASVISYIGPVFIIFTLQGDSSPERTVDEATDSSKNEKHGDGGRTEAKSEKQIKDLEQQKKLAKNKKERQELEKTIRNVRQNGKRKNRGEEHGRNSKR